MSSKRKAVTQKQSKKTKRIRIRSDEEFAQARARRLACVVDKGMTQFLLLASKTRTEIDFNHLPMFSG